MTMRIPLSSPDITQTEIDAVTAVLRTNRLSLGPELEAFEHAMAAYHGVPDAIAVSSGTAGLHLALLALNIREGDEVILPSFAFIAVANAVTYVRATPVFVDIDPATLNLDPALIEQAITPRTRAILIVHTFGVPADMDRILAIARRHNLAVIEDACEAIGATYNAHRVGSFGDLAIFGFYPNKQITTGEGGCVLARDPALARRIRSLRNQGRMPGPPENSVPRATNDLDSNWLEHAEIGYNYRLSELACALGRVQLARIDEILALRRAAAERYHALLSGIPAVELPPAAVPQRTISWFVYVVRLGQTPEMGETEQALRGRVQASLAARGIATARYFAPIHLQPAWLQPAWLQPIRLQPGGYNPPDVNAASLHHTVAIAGRTLALPFFNRITPLQQSEVAQAVIDALTSIRRS